MDKILENCQKNLSRGRAVATGIGIFTAVFDASDRNVLLRNRAESDSLYGKDLSGKMGVNRRGRRTGRFYRRLHRSGIQLPQERAGGGGRLGTNQAARSRCDDSGLAVQERINRPGFRHSAALQQGRSSNRTRPFRYVGRGPGALFPERTGGRGNRFAQNAVYDQSSVFLLKTKRRSYKWTPFSFNWAFAKRGNLT